MSYIASVLLVVTLDSMRVERLVSLYNDVKTIRRSGLSEETERPSFNRVQVHWCSQLGSTTGSSQILHRKKHGDKDRYKKTRICSKFFLTKSRILK